MRHILYVDPEDAFVVTAITWLPGQQSRVVTVSQTPGIAPASRPRPGP